MTPTESARLDVLEDWRTRIDEWQREQNGALKSLADSYSALAERAGQDKAYRKGRIDGMKVLVGLGGLGGLGGLASLIAWLTQAFGS
jgi:hypothetical protein